jgi:hypothetical protein
MNPKDLDEIVNDWDLGTDYRKAQDHAYALGLKRGKADCAELVNVLTAIIADGLHCDVVPHLHEKASAALSKFQGENHE